MENSNENTFGGVLITALGCAVIGGLHYLADRSLFTIILFGTAAIGIIVFYILRQTVWKSTETLEEDICKRLKKAGFQFEKKEGNLFVVKNENRFQVQLADTYNRRIKHLYVYYKFTDDNSNKINVDGWSRASNIINVRNTETIFVRLEDHFCCCYQTAIGNSKDFMKEFNYAYDVIVDAMDDYKQLFPLLERDYPNHVENQTSIGFKQTES